MSVFGGSAWSWNDTRGEWFLHQFYSQQPDLNLRNHRVVQALKSVLRFWLDAGVDGFRVDAVPHFFEDDQFRDEDVVEGKPVDSYDSVKHNRTYNLQPETSDLLRQFRHVLDEYPGQRYERPHEYTGWRSIIYPPLGSSTCEPPSRFVKFDLQAPAPTQRGQLQFG